MKPMTDPVLEVFLRDVDLTLLRENLKLTPGQRLEKFVRFSRFTVALKQAGAKSRAKR
ncbi:MAG: hypothetical protein ABJC04_05645 [Verrucomicrobiota bacterium]